MLLLWSLPATAQLRLPTTNTPRFDANKQSFSFRTTPVVQVLRPDFYTQHLGFFCRQELLMQKKNIPVIFRLGSVEQCNYLEQKPGFRLQQ